MYYELCREDCIRIGCIIIFGFCVALSHDYGYVAILT